MGQVVRSYLIEELNRWTKLLAPVEGIGYALCLTAAKCFQRWTMTGTNERRQPFFGCDSVLEAF